MAFIPDELWYKILEIGIQNPNFNNRLLFKDLCRLSLSSPRFHLLSNDPSLWSSLLFLDFPSRLSQFNDSNVSSKLLYRSWYEKDKARRIAAENRAIMRIESRIMEHLSRAEDLRQQRVNEGEKIKCVIAELNDLRKVRQASVALNVWQPEVIRGRQKQIVEQCAIPVDSRINALEMELKVCKRQMKDLDKSYKAEKQRLEQEKERLTSLNYHPLRDHAMFQSTVDGCKIKSTAVDDHSTKRMKFKRTSDDFDGLCEA